MSTKLPAKGILVFALALLLIAILAWNKVKENNNTANENSNAARPAASGFVQVGITVARLQALDNKVNATGTLLPNEQVDLKSEINGRIIKINFQEGTSVKKGELLIKLFDTDLQAQKNKLELQKKLAEEKEYREQNLLAKGAVSQEEYDNVLNQVNGLKADLDLVKSQIEKTEIRAPFNGTVGLRYASEGSYAMPTQKIASIVDDEKIKIDFSVPEKYAAYVKKGTAIEFSSKSSAKSSKGVVYAIEPLVDATTRSIQVRAIANSNANLVPGSFAEVTLLLNDNNKGILVPTEAIVPELKGQKVFLYKAGRAVPQMVQTGTRTDTQVEITNGIQAGDTVITKGVIKVKPNGPVKITK